MHPIDQTTGLPCGLAPILPVQACAWLVEYQGHRAVFLDRARAEQAARDLHGLVVPLVRVVQSGEKTRPPPAD